MSTDINETERIRALKDLGVLDTPPEERFDRLTRLARRVFDVPIAEFGSDDQKRRWLPELLAGRKLAAFGLTEPGGGSDAAVAALASCIDVFMLCGEPLAETAAFMSNVRRLGGGETIRFSVSTRPILGRTDAEAWERAHDMFDRISARMGDRAARAPENVGSQRLLQAAASGEVHDTCLWTRLAELTGARGNSTALVGSPDTVAEALVAYYDIGATTLLIRGYDPLPDAIDYGADLIPRVRRLVAKRDA